MKKALLTGFFTFCLYPVSAEGLSVNYSFVLLPLFCLLTGRTLQKPPALLLILVAWYAIVFVLAALYQYDLHSEGLRRVASFLLFMSIFSYSFMRFDSEFVQAFKAAVVAVSIIMSLASLYSFLTAGGSALGFEAKDLVGTQRFGFIYLMAIWLLYLWVPSGRRQVVFRYFSLAVILIGLLLTFSRSSVIALLVTMVLFAFGTSVQWVRAPTLKGTAKGMLAIFGAIVLFVTLVIAFPLTYDFFRERIVDFALDPAAVTEDLDDEGSAGTRLVILRRVIEYVASNPLTGSGYLGVWTLFEGFAGSAHNQYADVFFRTGVVGFAGYCGLLFAIGLHLYRNQHQGLFWGFLGVVVYGFFHETFKESHGGFVLAFLVGMTAQWLRTAGHKIPLATERDKDRGSTGSALPVQT